MDKTLGSAFDIKKFSKVVVIIIIFVVASVVFIIIKIESPPWFD